MAEIQDTRNPSLENPTILSAFEQKGVSEVLSAAREKINEHVSLEESALELRKKFEQLAGGIIPNLFSHPGLSKENTEGWAEVIMFGNQVRARFKEEQEKEEMQRMNIGTGDEQKNAANDEKFAKRA